jgi:Arrestin (or S-antigen), C-terminal domain/Arrestin (or S-antigen), N-terminal domain
VYYSDDQANNEQLIRINYDGKEKYIDSALTLFGHPEGPPIRVRAGTHQYDFNYPLIDSLPASFYTKRCSINYNISAFLNVPFGVGENVQESFTVVRPDDVKLYPELNIPLNFEETKTFRFLFWKGDPFVMRVTIPQSVFPVGHFIPIKFKYSNKSITRILSTEIHLQRTIEYKVLTPREVSRKEEKIVVEKTERGVKPKCDEEFDCSFYIPETLSVSTQNMCKIIKISYKLVILAIVDEMYSNILCEFPVVLISNIKNLDNSINLPVAAPSAPSVLADNEDDQRKNFNKN